ncbi:Protein CBG26988 [Caenorhabditis briggsae]|uniref:Protein CBG26988 n=1 Tax=Caenorhabditis briggsae TaxID=6238 RepID=B6IEV4_CAEBR|nr:Protein CBG26988 [Caenorhabditis briggsae]CAR98434.1 Protein CBG26988 [Caenorhabditis briggsae]
MTVQFFFLVVLLVACMVAVHSYGHFDNHHHGFDHHDHGHHGHHDFGHHGFGHGGWRN